MADEVESKELPEDETDEQKKARLNDDDVEEVAEALPNDDVPEPYTEPGPDPVIDVHSEDEGAPDGEVELPTEEELD